MWAQRSQQGIKTGRFDEPCEGPLPGEGPHKASVADGQRLAVRHAAYHTNTAHLTGTQTLSRVNRGDIAGSRFEIRPIPTLVEMHLIERAFGQIHDLQRRLEIAGGETAFRWPAIGRPPRRVSHEHGAPDGHPNLKPRQPR